jgi:hypothetical protein
MAVRWLVAIVVRRGVTVGGFIWIVYMVHGRRMIMRLYIHFALVVIVGGSTRCCRVCDGCLCFFLGSRLFICRFCIFGSAATSGETQSEKGGREKGDRTHREKEKSEC